MENFDCDESDRNNDLTQFTLGNRIILMTRIEELIINLIFDLCYNKRAIFQIKEPNYVVNVDFQRDSSRSKFATIIFMLSKVYGLLSANKTCTKREIYYENVNRFRSQNEVNRALYDISRLLKAPVWQLRIHGTSKGLISGPATFVMKDGTEISTNVSAGIQIPDIIETARIISTAKWIFVIEKDAAFQKIIQDGGAERLGPCIFITGKGFPDVNTRMAVCELYNTLKIPVYALVDADPHGIDIMCVYRFGSAAMAGHSAQLACSAIRWLGIHPSDISRLQMKALPLTHGDRLRAQSLLTRSYISSQPALSSEVEALINGELKAEIEGVCTFSPTYLTNVYIQSKLRFQEYF